MAGRGQRRRARGRAMKKKKRKRYVPPKVQDVGDRVLNVYAAATQTAEAGRNIFTALWATGVS